MCIRDRQTSIRLHLQCGDGHYIAMHCFELLDEVRLQLLTSSGAYTNLAMGCFLSLNLKPNKHGYLFVFSTMDPDDVGIFYLELCYSSVNAIKIIPDYKPPKT
eukprot:TRINITY_DN10034_c0_g1_i1.p1 TRINITY_DN10034_c0_g1~~TRINITY_DN10034_c0_g1_i1.p1  ORF type:complete len:103 (+),score=16.56 TRINITY_DN10034_c0_g1_i1:64-372(+)